MQAKAPQVPLHFSDRSQKIRTKADCFERNAERRTVQYFFRSSISALMPFLRYRSESRCSSAEGASRRNKAALSRVCRLGIHISPLSNSTWLTNPVMPWIFTGWPLRENRSVESCMTSAVREGRRRRPGSEAGSEAARYCRPLGSLTSHPSSKYLTVLLELF